MHTTRNAIRFVAGRHPKSVPSLSSTFLRPRPCCRPQLIYSCRVVFPPPHRGGPQSGAVAISSTGYIESIYPSISPSEAKELSTRRNLDLVVLGDSIALSPGLIDVHCHISELGRDWEGYHTATRAAAAGGITTLMGMPLNSIPATSTVNALQQEIRAASKVDMMADVGLWGGAVPSNTSDDDGLASLGQLLDAGVFGLKAFLAPLPPDAGYETVTPEQLRCAAKICGEKNKPLLVHSELMTQENQDVKADESYKGRGKGSYEAHVASRPAQWERSAVQVVCDLTTDCHMHVVHLSDAGCLDIIKKTKRQLSQQRKRRKKGNLTVETCPHYLLFDSESLPDGDTRYKCFPPIRSKNNQKELWRGLLGDINNPSLVDMIASDHSPCTPDLRLQDTSDVRKAWGGLTGLQYQLPATAMALNRAFGTDDEEKDRDYDMLASLADWWSNAPSHLVPGLSLFKGTIDIGQQADLCAWDSNHVGKPSEFSVEHHRWKEGGVYADMNLRGRVVGTWLRGVRVYDGETDSFPAEGTGDGVGSFMLA